MCRVNRFKHVVIANKDTILPVDKCRFICGVHLDLDRLAFDLLECAEDSALVCWETLVWREW